MVTPVSMMMVESRKRNHNLGPNKSKMTLTIDNSVMDRLDRERGDVERSVYIQRLLERQFKMPRMPFRTSTIQQMDPPKRII